MKKTVIFLFAAAAVLSSCTKEQDETPNNSAVNNIGRPIAELNVSESFDWKTSQDIEFVFNSENTAVVAIESVEGGVYEKGFIKEGARYSTTLSLPSSMETVVLSFNNKKVTLPITGNKIEYTHKQ